jgi:hypothetical protein
MYDSMNNSLIPSILLKCQQRIELWHMYGSDDLFARPVHGRQTLIACYYASQ